MTWPSLVRQELKSSDNDPDANQKPMETSTCIEIIVGHVLDPITYLVSKPRRVSPEPELAHILALESQLRRDENILPRLRPGEWEVAQHVAVLCSPGIVRRGRIRKINHGKCPIAVEVLLIDSGEILPRLEVHRHLRGLPNLLKESRPYASKLVLEGIAPKAGIGQPWSPGAKTMIRALMDAAADTFVWAPNLSSPLELWFAFAEVSTGHEHPARVVYNSMIRGRSFVSVREILVNSGFAQVMPASSVREPEMPLLPPTDDEHLGETLPVNSSVYSDGSFYGRSNAFIPEDISEIEVRVDGYHSQISLSSLEATRLLA